MLYIIQNDPEVPPGNLLDFITVPYRLCRADQGEQLPSCDQITALIVLGGAMGAHDDAKHPFLTGLKQLIHQVVTTGKPYLGICLGGQLLAAALGAAVISNRWEELGTLPLQITADGVADPLMRQTSGTFHTFQWHHDSFDIPDGAVLLASSPACRHQAFRYGEKAWGFQFHPEVTEQIIRDWCAWAPDTACQVEQLVADFLRQQAAYRQTAQSIITSFLALCH